MKPFPFSEYIVPAIFALAVLTTIAGALIAVLSTRIIRSVGGLMICCVGLAGLYYFLNSPFLALMEILIYVGAVCVTIVFGVMLSEPDEPTESSSSLVAASVSERTTRSRSQPPAAWAWSLLAFIVAALVTVGLARLSLQGPWPAQPAMLVSDGSVAAIGNALLTTYALAFEVISVVLLVAILGALVIARSGRTISSAITPHALGIVAAEVTRPAAIVPANPSLLTSAATKTAETHS